jgi:ribulose-5-phosphate 4-epimerase/fuculose-1-phosphate aldolase
MSNLVETGVFKTTEGNVSVRVNREDSFAITPSSYDYAIMEVDDICVLDFDLTQRKGNENLPLRAPCMLQSIRCAQMYMSLSIRIQPYASALGIINKPIPHLFDEQVRFLGRSVEIIPYAPSGTGFLKKNVLKKVRNGNNAFILQNHGVLVLGGNAELAIHNMALLEKCALDYLLALMTGEKVSKIPLVVREIAFAQLRADEKKLANLTKEE